MPDLAADYWKRNEINYLSIGRLRLGVDLAGARAEFATIAAQMRLDYPDRQENQADGITLVPLATELAAGLTDALLLFQVAVALVLLVGCANIASAGLARGVGRRRELAIRSALGAGRRRLVRQLVTEHLLLGLVGGVLGVLMAVALVQLFARMAPASLLPYGGMTLDLRVIAIALFLSLGVGLLAGPCRRCAAAVSTFGQRWSARRQFRVPSRRTRLGAGGRRGGPRGNPPDWSGPVAAEFSQCGRQ